MLKESVIRYVKGDATRPLDIEGFDEKVIVHICNDKGAWGSGFVLAVSKRWPEPERMYRDWHKNAAWRTGTWFSPKFELGNIQTVRVNEDTLVANMIAQTLGYGPNGEPPIRYDALLECLLRVHNYVQNTDLFDDKRVSVHMPRIGCGLAGGTWDKIEPLIMKALGYSGTEIVVYDL